MSLYDFLKGYLSRRTVTLMTHASYPEALRDDQWESTQCVHFIISKMLSNGQCS